MTTVFPEMTRFVVRMIASQTDCPVPCTLSNRYLQRASLTRITGSRKLPAAARTQMPPMIGRDLRDRVFKAKAGDILVGRSPGDQSVLIVEVREVVEVPAEALAKSVEELDEAFAGGVAADTLELFGRALESRHGATFNEAAVDSVFDRLGQIGY